MLADRCGDEIVAVIAGMHAVRRVNEGGVCLFRFRDLAFEVRADVDDVPAPGVLGNEPLAVGVELGMVAVGIGGGLVRIVERGCDENDGGSGFLTTYLSLRQPS